MALIELFDAWAKASDMPGAQIRVLLLNFRKAFDLIDHNILLAKLCSYGVPPVLLRLVHAFLLNRQQRTKCGLRQCLSGVKYMAAFHREQNWVPCSFLHDK